MFVGGSILLIYHIACLFGSYFTLPLISCIPYKLEISGNTFAKSATLGCAILMHQTRCSARGACCSAVSLCLAQNGVSSSLPCKNIFPLSQQVVPGMALSLFPETSNPRVSAAIHSVNSGAIFLWFTEQRFPGLFISYRFLSLQSSIRSSFPCPFMGKCSS